jgi:hypothetical protein
LKRCRAVVRGIHRTIGTAKAPNAGDQRSATGHGRASIRLGATVSAAGLEGSEIAPVRLAGVGGLLGLGKVLSPVERDLQLAGLWTAMVWPGSSQSSGSIIIGASRFALAAGLQYRDVLVF